MKHFYLLVFIIAIFHFSKAQIKPNSLELGLQLGVPKGEFANTHDNPVMIGIGGRGMGKVNPTLPIQIGASFYYLWMNTSTQTFRFDDPTFGEYEVTSEVRGASMPIHLHVRILPFSSTKLFIQPYLESTVGFRLFDVRTSVEVDDLTNTPQPEKEVDHSLDVAGSYGIGLGSFFHITDELYLNFKWESLRGGKASYLDPKSVSYDGKGNPSYKKNTSKTNVDHFELGIAILF